MGSLGASHWSLRPSDTAGRDGLRHWGLEAAKETRQGGGICGHPPLPLHLGFLPPHRPLGSELPSSRLRAAASQMTHPKLPTNYMLAFPEDGRWADASGSPQTKRNGGLALRRQPTLSSIPAGRPGGETRSPTETSRTAPRTRQALPEGWHFLEALPYPAGHWPLGTQGGVLVMTHPCYAESSCGAGSGPPSQRCQTHSEQWPGSSQ